MSRALKSCVVAVLLTLFANSGAYAESALSNLPTGAQKNTEHTFKLSAGAQSPKATIGDAAWLAGSWEGDAFGSRFEEVWNPPSANSMVGMFKVFDEEKGPVFYELMLINEVNDSLVLKVKHFSADFSAWEEKAEYVSFPLVSASEQALHFEGLSFYRVNNDTLDTYVVISQKDGSLREEKLNYSRVEKSGDK